MTGSTAAVEAIQFALETDDSISFLRLWNVGEFDIIRKEWPECPEAVFDGAEVKPGEVVSFRAKAYSVACPQCEYEHFDLIQDPRGLDIDCEGCGKTFKVPTYCDIEVS